MRWLSYKRPEAPAPLPDKPAERLASSTWEQLRAAVAAELRWMGEQPDPRNRSGEAD